MKRLTLLILFVPFIAQAQHNAEGAIFNESQFYKGYVYNRYGNPLSGIQISCPSFNSTVVSDSTGFFALEAKPGDKLQIRHANFQNTSIKCKRKSELKIFLYVDDSPKLIPVAYGKQKRENVISSIGLLSGKELEKLTLDPYLDDELNVIPGVITVEAEIVRVPSVAN